LLALNSKTIFPLLSNQIQKDYAYLQAKFLLRKSIQIQTSKSFPTHFQILSKQGYAYLQAKVLETKFSIYTSFFKQFKQTKSELSN